MDDFVLILRTCDAFLKYCEGVAYTVEKYYPNHPEMNFLTYKNPDYKLPEDWKKFSMGLDLGIQIWSNGFIEFFNSRPDIKFFLLFFDDMFVLDKVDSEQIKYLLSMMKIDEKIGKIQLGGSHTTLPYYESVVKDDKYDLVSLSQNVEYRASTQPAIWRVDYFLKYLRPLQSPWDYENVHPRNDGYKIYSVRSNRPLSLSHFFRHGNQFLPDKWYQSWTDNKTMSEDDKEIIRKKLNFD